MHIIKRLINFAILFWQCHMLLASPGIVDSTETRKNREKASITQKFQTLNSIASVTGNDKQIFANTQPLKITHDDVVKGVNSVYGSQPQFSNGGIIFAITGQSSQSSLVSAAPAQPVLLQYLSPEGMPKQTAVQYIQVLQPLMMVPAQPYLPDRLTTNVPNEQAASTLAEEAKQSPFVPFAYAKSANSLVAAQSAPQTSYHHSNPRPLITLNESNANVGLNMNEYIPSASSRIASTVIAPQVAKFNFVAAFKPSVFSMLAQRA